MPPEKTVVEEAQDVEATSKTFRNHKGRTAAMVAVIGAVCAGVASIAVPIAQSYFGRPPAPKSNLEEVLKAYKEASERQDKEIRQGHEDIIELRAWLKGYLASQGVTVRDPPDTSLPAVPVVEITKPLLGGGLGGGRKPAPIQVGTPLPSPKPLPRAKEIPSPFVPKPAE